MKSLYIHIPFCSKKCLFCSFAISVGAAHRVEEYLDALETELINYDKVEISTIYFGGGTPNFIHSNQIARIMKNIKDNFQVSDNASWSMEVNPEKIDAQHARQLSILGFNRVSLGMQTFNDVYLKFLGRTHDRATGVRAYAHLRDAGFKDINIDLMYGFPGQTRAELAQDLNEVITLYPQHVSIYTLTIEPNSRFYVKAVKLDSDDKLADDYVFVSQSLEAQGLKQYEVSNFAQEGFMSRHNLSYWQGGDYIGVGMGAHGLDQGRRYWNEDTLSKYIDAIKLKGNAVHGEEKLSSLTRLTEDLIFGLRMNAGVSVEQLEQRAGVTLKAEQSKELASLIKEGFLEKDKGFIRSTIKGRLVLDEIAVRLI